MPQKGKKRKIFLGMSGGVDSSVSAALLLKGGYEVIGVFIKVWEPSPSTSLGTTCGWRAEWREAMRVAAHLGIPLLTIDLSKEYEKEVVNYMIKEYKRGRTPNPDVMCNRYIKFGAFYDWAMTQGADYVATGHYARVSNLGFALRCSADTNKDQTYFLWDIKRERLPHVLFPVGHLTKTGVRRLAKKFGLPNAEKKDSQGLCFIGQFDFKNFLKRQIGLRPGKIFDEQGQVIGEHDGAVFYTIGERHGFKVRSSTSNTEPLYVIERDIKNNKLVVAPKLDHKNLDARSKTSNKEVALEKVNWLVEPNIVSNKKRYQARIRHRGELLPCLIKSRKSITVVEFVRDPEALAPGQSLVLYDKDICLGGGIIV